MGYEPAPDKWPGRRERPGRDHGHAGQPRSPGGGPGAAARATPLPARSPPPPAADFQPGLPHSGEPGTARRNRRGLRSAAAARGPGAKGARSEVQALAGGRPGGGARKAKATWATGSVAAARRGPRVRRDGAQPRQVPSPPTLQRPRALTRPAPRDGQRPPPRLQGTAARALDRKAPQPLRAGARAEGGCVRLSGHLAG